MNNEEVATELMSEVEYLSKISNQLDLIGGILILAVLAVTIYLIYKFILRLFR